MTERYPGYDVMRKQASPSWDAVTRDVVARRLAVPRKPRFFNGTEWQTLLAVCDRILPQPLGRSPVPLPAYVDAKIADNHLDGYRYATLPHQGEAWRRGLAALDAEAMGAYGARFHTLTPEDKDIMLTRMQDGALTAAAWGDMPCKSFFEHRVLADITHAYYAHPVAWSEIGFAGPASPRGYVRMQLDRRDPWEPVEAKPGQEAQARRENSNGL
jgi:hypothetical protein